MIPGLRAAVITVRAMKESERSLIEEWRSRIKLKELYSLFWAWGKDQLYGYEYHSEAHIKDFAVKLILLLEKWEKERSVIGDRRLKNKEWRTQSYLTLSLSKYNFVVLNSFGCWSDRWFELLELFYYL